MRPEAVQTAHILSFFDELFDSLNGFSILLQPGKSYKCAVSQTSGHVAFWNRCIRKLQDMSFLKADGTTTKPPSLKNFIFTLKNFVTLSRIVNNLESKLLLPRRFNQDPIENFFSTMRLHGGRNANPSCSNFQHYFKSLLVRNFISSKSIGSNCENDQCMNLFTTLKHFITQDVQEDKSDIDNVCIFPIDNVKNICQRSIDEEALGYVAGFISKKLLKYVRNCEDCIKAIISMPNESKHHSFIALREYEGSNLLYCNESFFNILKEIYNINMHLLPQIYAKKKLLQTMVLNLNIYVYMSIDCNAHGNQMREFVFKKFSTLIIYNYINGANKILNGKESRVSNTDSFYVHCKNKYQKKLKYKCN